MKPTELIRAIEAGKADEKLKSVYVTDEAVETQKLRYIRLINEFIQLFGDDRDVIVTSAPGRTEVCGNHTDHNNGRVLAASINLDAVAVSAKNEEGIVRVKSDGHAMNVVDTAELLPNESEFGHSTAMVRGVVAKIGGMGYKIGGFDAVTTSDVKDFIAGPADSPGGKGICLRIMRIRICSIFLKIILSPFKFD